MARISASILGFYFEAAQREVSVNVMIDKINSELKKREADFDMLHLDIEDGRFVEQKSFTPATIRKIKCPKKREAHLMVLDYEKYIKEFFDLAEMFIIHIEVLKSDFGKTIHHLHRNKKFVGLAINPDTSIEKLLHLDKIDSILVMSVHPGLPGQKFIEHSLIKVKKLYELRKKNNYKYVIEIDGGIDAKIAEKCSKAGADIVVMGSHFFG